MPTLYPQHEPQKQGPEHSKNSQHQHGCFGDPVAIDLRVHLEGEIGILPLRDQHQLSTRVRQNGWGQLLHRLDSLLQLSHAPCVFLCARQLKLTDTHWPWLDHGIQAQHSNGLVCAQHRLVSTVTIPQCHTARKITVVISRKTPVMKAVIKGRHLPSRLVHFQRQDKLIAGVEPERKRCEQHPQPHEGVPKLGYELHLDGSLLGQAFVYGNTWCRLDVLGQKRQQQLQANKHR